MFQSIVNRIMARTDRVRQAWRAMRDGYRFGRDLTSGRSAECPMCHMTRHLTNTSSENFGSNESP